MKKVVICLIILLSNGVYTIAQQYFNKRETLNSISTILTSVYEMYDKYYTTGICLDSINQPQGFGYWGIEFSIFDKYGSKLRDTFYQKNGRSIYSWNSKLVQLPENSFLVAVDAIDFSQWYLMLFRFDTLGRVLMEKEYYKPVCPGINPNNDIWRLTDFKQDGHGNWLMLSTIGCSVPVGSGLHADMLLTKLDSSFNVLWYRQYGHVLHHDIAGKLLIESDGYLLSGGYTNNNRVSKNFLYQSQLIKVDTAGNQQWSWMSPANKLTNTIQDIIKTQDGGYVYCGQGDGWEEAAPDGIHADINWKGWVEKLDVNRNPLWSKTLSMLSANSDATDQRILKELADETIAVGGMVYGDMNGNDTLFYNYGSLVKLDKNGNDIWQRKYLIPNDTLLYRIYDMKHTTDAGFILCGEARDAYYPYNPPTQRAWLIKVDSNGCMSATDPQCHPTHIPQAPRQTATIYVYPNPVSGTLFINNANKEAAFLTLYNLMGSTLQQQSLHKGINEIDITHLPAGVYVYKLSDKQRNSIQQGKVVKE